MKRWCLAMVLLLTAGSLSHAQDTRNVTEPVFPKTCVMLQASLATVTKGGLLEPGSETAFDTARIQTALDQCKPNGGKPAAVELSVAGANNAFLIGPIRLPTGVTLLVDGGVTLYASRNPCDYQRNGPANCVGVAGAQGPACGVIAEPRTGCKPLITVEPNPGASEKTALTGIMGYGVIDGRGTSHMLIDGKDVGYAWYDLTRKAYATGHSGKQELPLMIYAQQVPNFVLYKITLRNALYYNVEWVGSETQGAAMTAGFTAWGVKILAPYDVFNTDGIDPENNVKDVSIVKSYISSGDDVVAIDAYRKNMPTQDITISELHSYAGLGMSIGSGTAGGVNHVLIRNLTQDGPVVDGKLLPPMSAGLHIKSAADRGGVVKDITYEDACMRNENYPFWITAFFNSKPADEVPQFSNIVLRNVSIEANTVPGQKNNFIFQGYDVAHRTTMVWDNFYVNAKPEFVEPLRPHHEKADPTPRNTSITIGPGGFSPVMMGIDKAPGASNITYSGSNAKVPAGNACVFPKLDGELYGSGAGVSASSALTVKAGEAIELHAVLQPGAEEFPALTQEIVFLEGTTVVGHAGILPNSTSNFASVTVTPSAGAHIYTAVYSGTGNGHLDKNYPAPFAFGSVTVTAK